MKFIKGKGKQEKQMRVELKETSAYLNIIVNGKQIGWFVNESNMLVIDEVALSIQGITLMKRK